MNSKQNTKLIALVLLFALVLWIAGCSPGIDYHAGSEFVGTWDNITPGLSERIEITANGDQYVVVMGSTKAPAIYNDGMLTIDGMTQLTYMKDSDHMTFANWSGRAEYKRAK